MDDSKQGEDARDEQESSGSVESAIDSHGQRGCPQQAGDDKAIGQKSSNLDLFSKLGI